MEHRKNSYDNIDSIKKKPGSGDGVKLGDIKKWTPRKSPKVQVIGFYRTITKQTLFENAQQRVSVVKQDNIKVDSNERLSKNKLRKLNDVRTKWTLLMKD